MKVHKITLSKCRLGRLSEDERTFFLLAGHLANEINILRKMLCWCCDFDSNNEPIQKANTTQGMLIARTLAGKLYEGWNLLTKMFFASRLSRQYEPILIDEAKDALRNLKRYFGRKNMIEKVRNESAFHYSTSNIKDAFLKLPDDEDLTFYLADDYANSLYHAADLVTNFALLEGIEEGSIEASMERFMDEITKVAEWETSLISGCLIIATEQYIDSSGKLDSTEMDIQGAPSFFEVVIPYFVETSRT